MKTKFVNESLEDILKPKSKDEIKTAITKMANLTKKNYFTVKDLKTFLETIPDELPIGKTGHFGEFHPMDKYDFIITYARPVPKDKGWRDALNVNMPILQITSPDIGPEPD